MKPAPLIDAREIIASGEALVAVDLGGTTLRIGAMTREIDLRAPPPMTRRPTASLGADPVDALAAAIAEAVPPRHRLAGAAVGLPTQFDAAGEIAEDSPNLRGLAGRNVRAELEARLGSPVAVDRETAVLTHGERVAGAGLAARSLLGVFVGTGLGGCFLVDGKVWRGASGGAVEVGHVPIRAEGVRCVCGNLDCVEAYASGHALEAAARARGVPVAEALTHHAMEDFLAEYVRDLAFAIAGAVNILDPEVLVIGGGLHGRPGFPQERLAAAVRQRLRGPRPREHIRIAASRLGSEAAYAGGLHMLASRLGGRE